MTRWFPCVTHPISRLLCLFVVVLALWAIAPGDADAYCPSTNVFAQTFADTCWECMFPLSLVGTTVFNLGEDGVPPAVGPGLSALYPPQLCGCICLTPYLCVPGLPMGMFIPSHLLEVVRNPLCFPSLFGLTLGPNPTFIDRGLVDVAQDDPSLKMAYYHVHFIVYPLWALLSTEFAVACTGATPPSLIDVVYMSELDPMWADDPLSLLMFPEALLFANPVATAACSVDAAMAAVSWPADALFWCAGSFGNLYPPTGFTSGSYSGQVKPAALVITRLLSKLSRIGAELYWAANAQGICADVPTFLLVKSQYKFQLLYPIANTSADGGTCCSPIGRTQLRWGLAKTYPVDGDDFVFLLWKLQRCCLL